MFNVDVFAAASAVPLATFTHTLDGRTLSEFVYDGSEGAGYVVRMVGQFPKVITAAGESFLVNGRKVWIEGVEYTVSGVKIHKLCYMADPAQNRAFRRQWRETQVALREEVYACLCRFRLKRHCPHWASLLESKRPIIENAVKYMLQTCPPTYRAMLPGGRCLSQPSGRRGAAVGFSPYSRPGRGRAAASGSQGGEQQIAAAAFEKCYQALMAAYAAIKANWEMRERPLFEARHMDLPCGILVFEGDRMPGTSRGELITAHTVRGVPVVRFSDGAMRVLMEGVGLRLGVPSARAAEYKVYDSSGKCTGVRARSTGPFFVRAVNPAPMGIAELPCDEGAFTEMLLDARRRVFGVCSEDAEQSRAALQEFCVGLRESVDAGIDTLDPSRLAPAGAEILFIGYHYGAAVADCRERLSRLEGLYPRFEEEHRTSRHAGDSSADVLGKLACKHGQALRALERARNSARAAHRSRVEARAGGAA